jgi:hypothetical protein
MNKEIRKQMDQLYSSSKTIKMCNPYFGHLKCNIFQNLVKNSSTSFYETVKLVKEWGFT